MVLLDKLPEPPTSDDRPLDMGAGLDAAASRLFSIQLLEVGIELPDAAGPSTAMFDKLDPGLPWLEAIVAAPASAAPGPLDGPVAADASAPVVPQVLASGNWLANPQVTLKTSLGNIVAELYPNAAPVTAANWLAYVGSGFLDNLLFHRVDPGFVIQGGGFAPGMLYQTPPYAPIVLESNNGLANDRGTLAMARTDAANSATSQFFVNLVDNDFLNYAGASNPGYAVFGKVLSGLSVVDAISAVPAVSEKPVTDVKILEADQTKQGTLHSTTGRVDLGILAADVAWTGAPEMRWEYSLNAGSTWTPGAGRSFSVPQGAYEVGVIKVRYIDAQGLAGSSNSTGGNMVVDARAIRAGDGAANALTGSAAADVMYGLGGNDTLDGGSGNDSMMGGSGNDSYIVQSAGDRTVETSGAGTDRVSASVSFTLAANVENLTLTGSLSLGGTGNSQANSITGNTGANLLSGASGNDTLSGGAGNDILDGGAGNDSMVGATGNDRYTVDSSGDRISETTTTASEIDSVNASLSWTLGSNLEKLTLTGSAAINGTGNGLANTLTGNAGANVLDGGAGNDTLSGGAGLDTYRFSSALNSSSNVDTISGFVAVDDAIQLENGVFLKLTTTGVLSASFFRANSTGTAADSNDYIVYENDTGKLFYDADGNGLGAAVHFATLSGAPALTSVDIFVT